MVIGVPGLLVPWLIAGVLPAGHDDVVAALATAGQDMSEVRLAALAGMRRPRNLTVAARALAAGSAPRGEARLRLERPHTAGDLRAWWERRSAREVHGWLAQRAGSLTLAVGGWSWRCGFGLAAGGAGRRPGLTADGGAGGWGRGVQAWSRPPDVRSARGVVTTIRRGGVAGSLAAGEGRDGTVTLIAIGTAEGDATAIAIRSATGRWTGGLAARSTRGPCEVAFEAAAPLDPTAASGAGFAALAGWRHGRARLEILAVVAGAVTSPLAAPPPLLGRRGGAGWALRGTWRWASGPRLAVLAGQGRRRDAQPGGEDLELVDVLAEGRLSAGLEWEASWRISSRARWAWDLAVPWKPPTAKPGPERRALAALLRGREGPLAWRLELRSLRYRGAQGAGRRTLLGISAVLTGDRTELRGGLARAWGDPVDLVSVLVPERGRVLARHWGRWQGELWCGAGWHGRHHALRASGHLRRPARGGPATPELRVAVELAR